MPFLSAAKLRNLKSRVRGALPPALVLPLNAYRHLLSGEPEIRLLKTLVPAGRSSVDVGANTGVYAFWLSKLSAAVTAYEPNPAMAAFLRAGLPKRVRVVQGAVSDHVGSAQFVIPTVDGSEVHGWGHMAGRDASEAGRRFSTQLTRLDDEILGDVGFIKIDVEGHELSVLRGAEETLRRCRPRLLVEIEQRHLQAPIRDALDDILRRDYRGKFLFEGRFVDVAEFHPERHQPLANADALGRLYINNFLFEPA